MEGHICNSNTHQLLGFTVLHVEVQLHAALQNAVLEVHLHVPVNFRANKVIGIGKRIRITHDVPSAFQERKKVSHVTPLPV